MATNYVLAGPSSVFVNGNAYTTAPEVKYNVNSFPQEVVENWSGDMAIKQRWMPTKCMITFLATPSFDPTYFDGLQNAEVLLQLSNGFTVTYANAAVMSVGDIDANEGKCEIEFQTYTPVAIS